MKTWLIVRKEDLEVLHTYKSEEKKDSSADWNYTYAEPLAQHVDAEAIDSRWAMVEMQDVDVDGQMISTMVAIEDTSKRNDIEDQELSQSWSGLRADRDSKLKDTDHRMLNDYPQTDAKKTEYETYRQELRDFPSSVNDPRDAYTLPVEPS